MEFRRVLFRSLAEVRSQGRRVVREVGKCEGHGSNLPRTLPRFHSPARRARRRYARTMAADLGTLLDSSYLGDIAERSIADVRAMRAECQEVESEMSLPRRLVQGRTDIVGLELPPHASAQHHGQAGK